MTNFKLELRGFGESESCPTNGENCFADSECRRRRRKSVMERFGKIASDLLSYSAVIGGCLSGENGAVRIVNRLNLAQ